MAGDDESLQVEQVIEQLIARYPSVAAGDIEHTVRTIHKRFDHGRIRDFVPLLVEKAARRDLDNPSRTVHGGTPSTPLPSVRSAGKDLLPYLSRPVSRHTDDDREGCRAPATPPGPYLFD